MVILYVLSNTEATSEAQFMKKISNTEAELKKCVAHEKSLQKIFILTVLLRIRFVKICSILFHC